MSKYRSYTLKGVQAPTDFPEQVSDLEENRITAGLRIGVAEVKQDLSKRYWDHAAQTYLVSRPTPIGDTEWWLVEYVKHRLIRIMPSTRTGQRPLNGPSYEAESLARAVYLLGCSDHIWRGSNPLAFESTSVMRTLESLVIALHDAIGLVPCEIQVRKLHQGTNSVEMSLVLDNASATAVELTITLTFNRAHNRWYSKVKHAVETWTMWQLMSYGKLLQEIGEAVERWADLSPPKDQRSANSSTNDDPNILFTTLKPTTSKIVRRLWNPQLGSHERPPERRQHHSRALNRRHVPTAHTSPARIPQQIKPFPSHALTVRVPT